jgi:hypothetical protein
MLPSPDEVWKLLPRKGGQFVPTTGLPEWLA